jgi:hypothetical protein
MISKVKVRKGFTILVNPLVKGKVTTSKAVVSTVFPFKRVPQGQIIDISKIKNPLDKKRLKSAKPKTLAQSVAELEKNPVIANMLADLKKKKKTFDPSKIGTTTNHRIGSATFLEETQRLIILKQVAYIMENCQEKLLSPAFATVSADGKSNPVFDTQHGLNVVGLFAKHGLWENVDPAKWEDMEYPFFIINDSDIAFANEAAYHRNGKGQKKWGPFDFHRIKVAGVRHHGSAIKEYVDAEKRQSICEKYEAIPLPASHPQKGKAGTLDRIDAVYDWKHKTLSFILATHKKYWHGTKLDSAAFGLYGHLFEGMTRKSIPTSGAQWDEFLDNFHAIIEKCFTDLKTLRSETETAHVAWHESAYPNITNHKIKSTNCALAIVLKIYQRLRGTHPLTNDVNDFNYAGVDIYDYLDKIDVHEAVDNA